MGRNARQAHFRRAATFLPTAFVNTQIDGQPQQRTGPKSASGAAAEPHDDGLDPHQPLAVISFGFGLDKIRRRIQRQSL